MNKVNDKSLIMDSICKNCWLAGNVADSLKKVGWIGCRKPLQICKNSLNGESCEDRTAEEISADVYAGVQCKDAATGWVDNGPLGHPSGIKFNGILMTRGTTSCIHFDKNNN